MFDEHILDPQTGLALLCLFTAFTFWNNDLLFYVFASMALCTWVLRDSSY